MSFDSRYSEYVRIIESTQADFLAHSPAVHLLEPVRYALTSGGKRIRPVLVMLCCGAAGGTPEEARWAAITVEMLHNFTLVHDDIMDQADKRRGRDTVHVKWNEDTAILAGDAIIPLASLAMLKTASHSRLDEMLAAVSEGIIEVCEGQALDLKFERSKNVSIPEYTRMIELKTARMLVMGARLGALVADADMRTMDLLCDFASKVGIAFQIQDDILDIASESTVTGKRRGGDVIEGKKTFLVLKALENAETKADRELLQRFIDQHGLPAEEVDAMYDLFDRTGALRDAEEAVAELTNEARRDLEDLPPSEYVDLLRGYAAMLLHREF